MELSCENLKQLARLCRLELADTEIEKYPILTRNTQRNSKNSHESFFLTKK